MWGNLPSSWARHLFGGYLPKSLLSATMLKVSDEFEALACVPQRRKDNLRNGKTMPLATFATGH